MIILPDRVKDHVLIGQITSWFFLYHVPVYKGSIEIWQGATSGKIMPANLHVLSNEKTRVGDVEIELVKLMGHGTRVDFEEFVVRVFPKTRNPAEIVGELITWRLG